MARLREMALRGEAEEVALHQFYVTAENRFRSATRRIGSFVDEEFSHTFKLVVGGRLLEIEATVSRADFDLARTAARESVSKIRFRVDLPDAHWDIDFLLERPDAEGGEVYMTMAEAETEEEAAFGVPDFLAPHVDYVVPRDRNGEYSNRLLSDPAHARAPMARDGSRLAWFGTDYGLSAATTVPGCRYLVVTGPHDQVSWQSPFDNGDWRYVESPECARADAQADYDRFRASSSL